MKLREVVPRKLKLGDHVFYTHRASTSDGRDLTNGRFPNPASSAYDYYTTGGKPPMRFGRRGDAARWVLVWPETGYGIVTGLTYRAEGVITAGYEDEQGHLSENERYPLYEVKTALRGRPLLVPPWACFPLAWIQEPFGVNHIDDDTPSPFLETFDYYVDVFLRTQPEKVTHD